MEPTTVRAKFRCHLKDEHGTIKLHPVYGESAENKMFFKYTPGGEVVLYTTNPSAAAAFEINKEYYVDFIPAN